MKKTIIILIASFIAIGAVNASEVNSAYHEVSSSDDRKPARRVKAEIKEVTFSVHIHCASCVKKIQENISFEKGVKDLHVCMDDHVVSIKYDSSKTSEDILKAAIEELGYKVDGIVEEGHSHSHQ